MCEIIGSNAARNGAKKLPDYMKSKIVELLDVLEVEPLPVEKYDIKKMKGLQNTYRIRMGEWRIVYKIEFAYRRIVIVKIGHRGKIYK